MNDYPFFHAGTRGGIRERDAVERNNTATYYANNPSSCGNASAWNAASFCPISDIFLNSVRFVNCSFAGTGNLLLYRYQLLARTVYFHPRVYRSSVFFTLRANFQQNYA